MVVKAESPTEGRQEAMTIKRIAVSAAAGLLFWFVLLVIHEEWRLPFYTEAFGPPPFNPFRVWVPLVLIAGILGALNAFLRWADKQLETPAKELTNGARRLL